MAIFAIGDLHLSFSDPKPMDIFGEHWCEHEQRMADNWDSLVAPDDTVLVAGDVSWALKPEQAMADIEWIAKRPGNKVMIRGNHDYWWRRESTNRLQKNMPPGIILLQGHAMPVGDVWVAGTRGWRLEENEQQVEKIMQRELVYLDRALSEIPDQVYTIVLLHYPPFDQNLAANAFHTLAKKYRADRIVYGHIHGGEILEGDVDGISYICVSADQVGFTPVLIRE